MTQLNKGTRIYIIIPDVEERSGGIIGEDGGRARFILWIGWEVGGVGATSGSNSQGETLSGSIADEGSSQWTYSEK